MRTPCPCRYKALTQLFNGLRRDLDRTGVEHPYSSLSADVPSHLELLCRVGCGVYMCGVGPADVASAHQGRDSGAGVD